MACLRRRHACGTTGEAAPPALRMGPRIPSWTRAEALTDGAPAHHLDGGAEYSTFVRDSGAVRSITRLCRGLYSSLSEALVEASGRTLR